MEKLYRPSKLVDNQETLDEMYAKAKLLKAELGLKKDNLNSSVTRAKNLSEDEITKKRDDVKNIEYKESILEKYLYGSATIE